MTRRVLLGNYNGSIVFRLSKPGFDVTTTADENVMIDTGVALSRVLQRGTLTFAAGGSMTVGASLPSIGGAAPLVEFRTLEIDTGQTFAFYLWTTTDHGTVNGWTATATDSAVSVTRNFTSSVTQFVSYFAFAQRGTA